MHEYLTTAQGRRIAYVMTRGQGLPIVFLSGFMSDMEGTKAVFLEKWAAAQGRPFLRFDYSGTGVSDGAFEDGTIGRWFEDARAAIALFDGQVILVGSSMGGWISLLLARACPEKIAGLVTIAAAPDFTEDSMWAGFDATQRRALIDEGKVMLPSGYGDPYPVTRKLIEDGRQHLVLRRPLSLPFAVRMLQGTKDAEVSQDVALKILHHAEAADMRLTLVKGADHRFSAPDCLDHIIAAIGEVTSRAG